jgi:hypothetical protein
MQKKFIIIWIIVFNAAMIMIGTLMQPDEKQQALDTMIECYETTGQQCGLHNLLEEGDYEDGNIEWHRAWLESNELGLTEEDLEKGMLIIDYMEKLNVAERKALLEEMYELHIRRINP